MLQHILNTHINCFITFTDIVLSFSESQMTLAELKSLVEMMQNLPCVMDQLEEVQVRSSVILSKMDFAFVRFSP